MSPEPMKRVTACEVGYSGDDQILVCLRKMIELGGIAQMPELYAAMEGELNPHGMTLSKQGRSSLRYFVNSVAVRKGYIHRHDKANPGWRPTVAGRALVGSGAGLPMVPEKAEEEAEELPLTETPDDEPREQMEAVGLLVYVNRVLSRLPDIDLERLLGPDSTTLGIEGSPGTLLPTVRSMMSHHNPGEITLKLTLSRDGWHVTLDAHPLQED